VDLTCSREQLARCLAVVGRIAPAGGTPGVLAHLLVDAAGETLWLRATDLSVTVSVDVPGAIVHEHGRQTVPARLAAELIKSLPGEQVTLRGENGTVNVLASGYDASLKGVPPEEFPVTGDGEGTLLARISWRALQQAVRTVMPAAATEEARPILTGILFRLEGRQLTVAAADGYRLAEAVLPLEGADGSLDVVLPAAALQEIAHLPAGREDQVEVRSGGQRSPLVFRLPRAWLAAQAIEGRFPDYRQVIPAAPVTRVVCDRAALLKAVRVASQFLDNPTGALTLIVAGDGAGGGQVTILGAGAELGDACAREPAAVHGPDLTIRFTARYLLDGLSALAGAQAALELSDETTAAILSPVGEQEHSIYVMMPVVSRVEQ
jgi:DNA polymerase-3 subunit beta